MGRGNPSGDRYGIAVLIQVPIQEANEGHLKTRVIQMDPRSLRKLAVDLTAVVVIGLAMRFNPYLPGWLRDATGGVLYVCLVAILIRAVRPESGARPAAIAALGITCAIEFSQLWHPVWLDAIRATLPGRLALGSTFSWWDFPPYCVGAILAAAWPRAYHSDSNRTLSSQNSSGPAARR